MLSWGAAADTMEGMIERLNTNVYAMQLIKPRGKERFHERESIDTNGMQSDGPATYTPILCMSSL